MNKSKVVLNLPLALPSTEARVIVDGVDFTDKVTAISVDAAVGKATTVTLSFVAIVEITTDGDVIFASEETE